LNFIAGENVIHSMLRLTNKDLRSKHTRSRYHAPRAPFEISLANLRKRESSPPGSSLLSLEKLQFPPLSVEHPRQGVDRLPSSMMNLLPSESHSFPQIVADDSSIPCSLAV